MKKRILSAILVLAMVLSMAPAVVTAAPVETAQSPKAGTHAATGHTCESEGCGTTEWKAWPTDGTIPTSGHYYLTQNVKLNGQLGLSNKTLHICLNGYVMTAKANTRLGWLYGTSKLVITDCTAYEENGVYYAGAMTGGVDKVTSTGGGGAFYVYANATLELHDGKLTNCSSITGGGAIYNNGIVKLYGGELSGNVAASGTAAKHGGAIFNNAGGVLTVENVRFHDNHADNGEGGAFQNWGNATFTGCTFTGNNAATGGAMNLGGTNKTVLIDGCTFTGNTAGVVSAINNKIATGSITIKDTEITGNSNTSGFGAVNVLGSAKAVILQGKVVITDNTTGEDTPNNLHVQDGDTEGVDVSALTAGSSISVHLRGARTSFTTANATNNPGFFTADVDGKIVTQNAENRLQLETYVAPKHSHCVCDQAGCSDHEKVAFTEWNDATKLPETAGNYYLTTDVVVSYRAGLSDGEVKLCLNGHTITAAASYTNSRAFYLRNTAKLTLTDCSANPGKISGFTSTPLMFDSSCTDAVLDLYNIQVSGNNSTKTGSAIILQGIGTFNFYSGKVTGNRTTGNGTVYVGGKSTANLLGGEISGNTVGGSGGGIYAEGTYAKINLTGTAITGNTAGTNGGGILTKNQLAQLNISDDAQVTGNTANGATNNLYLPANVIFTPGMLHDGKQVGITAETAGRAISTSLTQDVSAGYTSDDGEFRVVYKNSTLYLESSFIHNHCLEGHENCTEHTSVTYQKWTDATKLPETAGNYCLMTDVVVSYRAGLSDGEVKLCLNGHTITAAASYTDSRAFYLRNTAKLTLTDCSATPGKISGFTSTPLMFDSSCTDAVLDLYNIQVSGNNSTKTGSAIILQGIGTFNFYSGKITGNETTGNGTVYVGGKSTANLLGGEISANKAGNGGGIYAEGTNAKINLTGTAITGNTAGTNGGGILMKNQLAQLNISDDAQVTGNTAKDKPSNLYLAGTGLFTAGRLSEKGNVGICADITFRAVSDPADQDVSAGYYSDDASLVVSYQDGALFLGAPEGHTHCACAGEDNHCNHAPVKFAPWTDATKLPESGNWYLTTDVVVTYRAGLTDTTLNLCLNGHTIRVADSYAKGRAFYVYGSSKLIMTDCNENPGMFTGAKASAIAFDTTCDGAQLDLHNITFTGNASTMGGGALMVQGNTVVNIYSGTYRGNTTHTLLKVDANNQPVLNANGDEQAANNVGGGAIASHTTNAAVNIYGGTFTENKAYALTLKKADGTTTVAGGNGGAIYAKGDLTIYEGVEIFGNEAENNGGGVCFGGNEAFFTMHGGSITGNTGKAGGGVIMLNRSTFNLMEGKITGNSGTRGGGVYVSINAAMNMDGGEISGNTVSGDAGGLYAYASVVTLSGGTIKNNKALGNGGAISSGNGTTTVDGVKVVKGAVITINKGATITGNFAEKNAGGIQISGKESVLTLNGGAVNGNTCKASAGGVLVLNYAHFELKSGSVDNNHAKACGGVYISTNTSFKMTGGTVSGNVSSTSTGGVHFWRSKGVMSGGSVSNNTAQGGNAGGIYLQGSSLQLTGTYIGHNKALKGNGGGVCTGQATVKKNGVVTEKYQCDLLLGGSVIEHNEAKNGGGVILLSYTKCRFTAGAIRNNTATTSAGGAYISANADLKMTGGSVTGNQAAANGGGLYHYDSTGSYTGGKIEGNTCVGNGGTFYSSGSKANVYVKGYDFTGSSAYNGSVAAVQSKSVLTMEDCKVYGNAASASGTVFIGTNSFGNFTNCKFYSNKSTKQGGAIYGAQNATATITDCIFTENTAGTDGGAICCRGSFYMTNCQVTDNTASGNGGGIATGKCGIRGSKFQDGLVLTNVTVTDNISGGQGGGLYLSTGCKTTMTDVTITGNESALEGGAFWAVDDTTLHNVTVTGNTSGGKGYAAWYDYSIYDGHSYFVGVHLISGDIIIRDNNGGNVYLDQQVAMSVDYRGLGENTEFGIQLDAGVLTNRLFGEYNYEGGNQAYTVTYGSRSLTEPEVDTALTIAEETQQGSGNVDVLLYVGIGVIGLAAIAAVALILLKKKAGKPAAEPKN